MIINQSKILALVLKQLGNFWIDTNKDIIAEAISESLCAIETDFYGNPSKHFFNGKDVVFSPYYSVHWMIFLYRMSHAVYKKNLSCPPPRS